MYLYNFLINVITIIKYYFSQEYDKSVFKCLINLLKFNIKIEFINRNIHNNNLNSDIDILITKNNNPIYIEVKKISNQTNNNNHNTIYEQIKKQSEILQNIKNNYILFIDDTKNTKLPTLLVDKILDFNKDINIHYNKIDKLPNIIKNKNIVVTQEFLGFIVSIYIFEYIFMLIMYILSKKKVYVDSKIFIKFNNRMIKSKSIIEKNRWDKVKNLFVIFDDEPINIIKNNISLLNRDKNAISYAYLNNLSIIIQSNNTISFKKYNIFINKIVFNPIPIYGSHQYNQINTNINNCYKAYKYINYNMLYVYFITKILFLE